MSLKHFSNRLSCVLPVVNCKVKSTLNKPKIVKDNFLLASTKFRYSQSRSLTHYPIDNELFGLTPEQVQLRETVFNFFQKEIAPIADKIDKDDDFPGMRDFWIICFSLSNMILKLYSIKLTDFNKIL